MKKFVLDIAEVGKDFWLGFVWLVDAADELGEILGDKAGSYRRAAKVKRATREVKNNCVAEV